MISGLCNCGCGGITKPATRTRHGNVAGVPTRFLLGHYYRGSVEERFWLLTEPEPMSGCWIWLSSRLGNSGHGVMSIGTTTTTAHRVAYELYRGPIPPGLDLDHLCRLPSCVNPWHLEAVTRRVNILRGNGACARHARKTHCIRGHVFSGTYIQIKRGNRRRCLECERFHSKKKRELRPDREIAHKWVSDALKSGKLLRPDICTVCGSRGVPIEAHHPDYRRPPDIVWMCRVCHADIHNKKR